MCGIAGVAFVDQRTVPDRAVLESMIHAVRHRGPDGFGFHAEPGIGLAHARLSIIDLTTGDQPIANEDGTVQVIFNGEIFNYVELQTELKQLGHRFRTQSDTEVIVHAYEQYGIDGCLERLNGQFAIALWDRSRRRLILARDRTGIRPLLYTRVADRWYFASEAKSLFASGQVPARLSAQGFADIAHFWAPLAPATAFAGILAVPPGHYLTLEGEREQVTRYWEWHYDDPLRPGGARELDAATEELRALFHDSVRLQLRADVPVGTYLSGGLDSAAVTAAARQLHPQALQTFSLSFDDPEFDEAQYQQQVATHLGTVHHQRRVHANDIAGAFARAIRHIEAPLVRTAGIPLMLLADLVRETGLKVVLTGEGADEVFAGYDIFKEAQIRRFWARQPDSAWRFRLFRRLYGYLQHSPTQFAMLAKSFFRTGLDRPGDPLFAHLTRIDSTSRVYRYLSPEFRAQVPGTAALLQAERVPRPSPHWPPLARDQYVEAKTLLAGYLLHAQGDRVAMAASIEARYPFLDHRLIEFAARLPSRWKLRTLQEKYLLKRAVADWIPPAITQRTKQPFRAPDSSNFFSAGKPVEAVADLLSRTSLESAGYFAADPVARLVAKIGRGDALGFSDNMAFMIILSTLQLHREFRLSTP
jgi:asparagine synthase (glutamine-hydrolysing)